MATKQSQRIGIWIIAIVMALGTLGSFFVVILQNDNSKIDAQVAKDKQDAYTKAAAEYQTKLDAQTAELSKTYYPILSQYTGKVGTFTAADVKSVTSEDLKVGDGEEIKEGTAYSAYYIGWNPEGKIFDQSIDGDKLKAPIPGGNLIQGWNEGVIGMKLGGVRVITMTADKAYGDKGSGDLIPPHTPLKFIVLAIPTPATIPVPDFSGLAQ